MKKIVLLKISKGRKKHEISNIAEKTKKASYLNDFFGYDLNLHISMSCY